MFVACGGGEETTTTTAGSTEDISGDNEIDMGAE
jgi:hypothetical protein